MKDILNLNKQYEYDTILSLSELNKKTGEIKGDFYPNYIPGSRTQDLSNIYYENGMLYVLLETLSIKLLEKDWLHNFRKKYTNIDRFSEDFDMCKIILKQHKNKLSYLL